MNCSLILGTNEDLAIGVKQNRPKGKTRVVSSTMVMSLNQHRGTSAQNGNVSEI